MNFRYKGTHYRLSLDRELGRHVEGKTEAQSEAEKIRMAIREGAFRLRAVTTEPEKAPEVQTLAAFSRTYFERRGKPATANDRSCLGRVLAFTPDGQPPLGETPLDAITDDRLELFFARLRQEGLANSTRNKYVQLVKALFRWATKKGYLTRNPVADSEAIRREKHAKRSRRLAPDLLDDKGQLVQAGEEKRLLAAAGPHLQRLIIAALETGMRRGELLNLQWRDVNLDRREINVRAENTKTRTGRVLPIDPDRLAGVLEMARTAITSTIDSGPGVDLDDEQKAALLARCYVFGDEAGQKVSNVKRAWHTAVLKAHGHTPEWAADKRLALPSRAVLETIDLHFHDLRHEAGSRLLETGWPLHHVQEMLGHANVSQTSTYLNATRVGPQDSMRRFGSKRKESAAPPPHQTMSAGTELSVN